MCTNTLVDESDESITSDEYNQIKITCPQCLSDHIVKGKSSIEEAFPRNLALQQMLEIKPTQLLSDKRCESCTLEYAFSSCLHCELLVCLECKSKHKSVLLEEFNKNTTELGHLCTNFICNYFTERLNVNVYKKP